MNKEPKVTIIVPVYNSEKYLKTCIDSILIQNYENFELIIVNDGSTDDSLNICKSYANSDNRIKLFSIKNSGLSVARNTGLDNSTGDFILFIDSDDEIPKNYILELMKKQQENNSDITCCSFTYLPGPCISHADMVCNLEDFLSLILYRDGINDIAPSKLYKANLFKDVRFTKGIIYEDFDIFYRLYSKASLFAITDKTTYYYKQNIGSITNNGFSKKIFTRIEICKRLIYDINREHPNVSKALKALLLDEAIKLYSQTPNKKEFLSEINWAKNTIKKNYKDVLNDPLATKKLKVQTRIYLLCPIYFKIRPVLKKLYIKFLKK